MTKPRFKQNDALIAKASRLAETYIVNVQGEADEMTAAYVGAIILAGLCTSQVQAQNVLNDVYEYARATR